MKAIDQRGYAGNPAMNGWGVSNASEWGQIEVITPDRASEMLETAYGIRNRRVRQEYVDRYAEDMLAGKWMMTGDPVRFNAAGHLIDGQHRLYAVIQSGVSIRTLVMYNVDAKAFEFIDDPFKRTPAQHLETLGYNSSKNLAATIYRILYYRRHGEFTSGGGRGLRLRREDYAVFAQDNPHLYDSISWGRRSGINAIAGAASLHAALHFEFAEMDSEDADEFYRLLDSGAGLQEGHPILTLRNMLAKLKGTTRGGQVDSRYVAALTIKAWNAWRAGRSMYKLSFKTGGADPTPFPEIT